MKELSLHVLDIVQNSLRAQATEVQIEINEDIQGNLLQITIEDNGKGIQEDMLRNITNPFITTRTLRKVGLGLPFLQQMCNECSGVLQIDSEVGKGTKVSATMQYDHIDRLPLGNMAETIVTLIMAKPNVKFIYTYKWSNQVFEMSTEAIKEILGGVPIENLEILDWIKHYIIEGEREVKKL